MFALSRKHSDKNFAAIVPQETGISMAAVHYEAADKPVLDFCEFLPTDATTDQNALSRVIKQHGLSRRCCSTLLNIGDYAVLNVEAPEVPPAELRAAVRWQIKDLIDFHIDDALVDVYNAPASGADGRVRNLHVVVCRTSMVQQRIEALQAADANLTTVDVPELVLRNLTAQLSEDQAGVALVYLAKDRGLIVLTRQSTLYLARTLDLGYADIYRANDDLALGEGIYEGLVLEVQRSLDYYDRYFMQSPISTVLLAPLSQEVPALLDYVEQSIGIRSRMLDLNEIFPQSALDLATQSNCLLAIGAAMRRESTTL